MSRRKEDYMCIMEETGDKVELASLFIFKILIK